VRYGILAIERRVFRLFSAAFFVVSYARTANVVAVIVFVTVAAFFSISVSARGALFLWAVIVATWLVISSPVVV
jgi:hypothetical protein